MNDSRANSESVVGGTALHEIRRGWPTLVGAAWSMGFGALTLFYYTQGLFLGPLKQEFGWTREQLSVINVIGGFLIAGASVLVGWIVDRFGVRAPALVAFVVVAAAYALLGLGSVPLSLFVLLQLTTIGFGAANGPANLTRAINQSFDKARGFALGAALSGPGLVAILSPPVVGWVIQTYGWRAGYLTMGVATAVCIPIVLGLLSFGRHREKPAAAGTGLPALSLVKALTHPIYLRLLASFLLISIGVGGLIFHMAPMLTDAGYNLAYAAKIQGLIGLSVLIGRLLMGYLVDRVFAPWAAAAVTTAAAAGLFLMAGCGPVAAPVTAILIGLAMGAEGDVLSYITARYFGLASYGQLYGLLYGSYVIGQGISSFLLARLHTAFGSYSMPLWIVGAILLGGAALLASAPRFAPAVSREPVLA